MGGDLPSSTGRLSWPKENQENKNYFMGGDLPSSTGRQHVCDTIHHSTSCLLPNTKAKDVTSPDDAFQIFFDERVMDVIANKTNCKKFATSSRLRIKPVFVESGKHSWIGETDQVELNALFGLIYFRGLLGMNLRNVDHLFADYA